MHQLLYQVVNFMPSFAQLLHARRFRVFIVRVELFDGFIDVVGIPLVLHFGAIATKVVVATVD